jgi:hypothetical protein
MKVIYVYLALILAAGSVKALVFTNTPSADSFVRSSAPTLNYGIAGSVSVSGSAATNASGTVNGIADSFVRFNTAAMVATFNSTFGPNNWVINGVTLKLSEQGAPPNNIFTRGVGSFEIRWIANDDWTEGLGSPQVPGTSGIVYNDEATLLNVTNDVSLGTYTNSGANTTVTYSLLLQTPLLNDIQQGGEVGLFFTPIDPNIGFTFNSRNFTSNGAWPSFQVSAVPIPRITTTEIVCNDIRLSCANGAAGNTYQALAGTNITPPFNYWIPVATNTLSASGPFTMTVSNALLNSETQRYYLLQTQ